MNTNFIHEPHVEFEQVIDGLAKEIRLLFGRQASDEELHVWRKTIRERYPRFNPCLLLSEVRKYIEK
ncbi:MAG: hypothetical protein K6U80_15085 [Firmicutes bacterium]|nr:hypothetical protein [Bacillota bacterium]